MKTRSQTSIVLSSPASQDVAHVSTHARQCTQMDWYLSGFVDGEGCFCVSFQPSHRHRVGWEIRPSFSVSQNEDRAQLLYWLADRWGCGSIRPDRSDRTLKYEVRALDELVSIVVPHFEACPLWSAKQRDVESFSAVCRMLAAGEQRCSQGVEKIARLAMSMNPSGKRKYRIEDIVRTIG